MTTVSLSYQLGSGLVSELQKSRGGEVTVAEWQIGERSSEFEGKSKE